MCVYVYLILREVVVLSNAPRNMYLFSHEKLVAQQINYLYTPLPLMCPFFSNERCFVTKGVIICIYNIGDFWKILYSHVQSLQNCQYNWRRGKEKWRWKRKVGFWMPFWWTEVQKWVPRVPFEMRDEIKTNARWNEGIFQLKNIMSMQMIRRKRADQQWYFLASKWSISPIGTTHAYALEKVRCTYDCAK